MFRSLSIINDFNREVLQIKSDLSLHTMREIGKLDFLKYPRGISEMMRV